MCSLLQSAVIDKEYTPDVLFGDSDSETASTIYDAVNLDMKSGKRENNRALPPQRHSTPMARIHLRRGP